jgi:hypothetical protein
MFMKEKSDARDPIRLHFSLCAYEGPIETRNGNQMKTR